MPVRQKMAQTGSRGESEGNAEDRERDSSATAKY